MLKRLGLVAIGLSLLAGGVSAAELEQVFSPEYSTLEVMDLEVPANGLDKAPLKLVLRDVAGQPLPHKQVTLVARDMGTGDEWRDTFLVDGDAEINWSYSTHKAKTLRVRVEHEGVRFADEAFINFYYTPATAVEYVVTDGGAMYEIDRFAQTRKYAPFYFDAERLEGVSFMSLNDLAEFVFDGIAPLYPGEIVGVATRTEGYHVLPGGKFKQDDTVEPTLMIQDTFAAYYGLE